MLGNAFVEFGSGVSSADPEGGTGGPDPPSGKSQIITLKNDSFL